MTRAELLRTLALAANKNPGTLPGGFLLDQTLIDAEFSAVGIASQYRWGSGY
jgi:hypothetical protein